MSVEIKANENGPYLIAGSFSYVDADGNEQTTPGNMVALCRCGHSGSRLFCDGSHSKNGFEAAAIVLKQKE